MNATQELQKDLASLASQGIYVGTSSWKYPGWRDLVYTEDRYVERGRFSTKKFNATCLAEYADVFPSVGVDHTFYDWPRREVLETYAAQTPEDFKLSFKVTEAMTVKRYPAHARYGSRAGRDNEQFLDPNVFVDQFLKPTEVLGSKRGALIFEFGTFARADFETGEAFARALDGFLEKLPRGPLYAVEVRNRNFLVPEYFAALARHGVSHVFSSWTRMPSIGEQMALESAWSAAFCVARALLRPGRLYEAAVERFQPYNEIRDENRELRQDLAHLIERALGSGRRAFIYVNNRAEGCAPLTIRAMLKNAKK